MEQNFLEAMTKFSLDEEHESFYEPTPYKKEYATIGNVLAIPSCDGKSYFVVEIQKYED